MKISFVIPVFRNEHSLEPLHHTLVEQVTGLDKEYEIVFIDDGSDDHSNEKLNILFEKDANVKLISLSRNFGQVPAVIAGLKEATGDVVIIMSADLQEPVEMIHKMLDAREKGNEIVIGHRIEREDGFIANNASKLFYYLIKKTNPKMPIGGFDFILLDRQPLDVFNQLDERNRFLQGDILWLGFSTTFIPYSRQKRIHGKSQWTLTKKLKYFIDGLLNTSYISLRIISLIGIVTSLLGFLYAIVIAYSRLVNKTPFDGWAPIMILILIIGGLIMIMLGIIGEYIWRIYDETRKRPLYIIKNKRTHDSKDTE